MKIGILTGGGDVPGLNPCIRSVTLNADDRGWEVIGFVEAELVSPGRYRLSRLLRGLEGTEAGTAAVGARVMVLDSRAVTLPVESGLLGETREFRVYAGAEDVEGTSLTVETRLGPALPLAPP